ncbi:nuclear transport factor 2 family protein [Mycobacterium sp. CVI_P3]|uniref:Nuclear transport factor 2 family protein n=1 Tax=Mycobacterium pinniadriaticum TaxID=2994102 RepID=A0ABT3SJN2_9MYCO|nr:nuclear transport factor 2 family protein [Mycobacterium pinniadriaticum]MCX2932970.1 nuclear transport factor 2 family protein [Mycobacterium pinniadriaticum]MCX2939358.1 nuclear transport factor 2 family protein [Mycobacterium pinniadriaticum]
MSDTLERLERRLRVLEDERDIARLIASYGPLVDSGEPDAVAALWAVDGGYDTGDWTMSSRDDIAAMVRSDEHRGLIARGCCHFFGPPAVTVDGDEAVAICQSMLLVRRESHGYNVARAGVHLIRLRRAGHGWEIVERTARQLDGSGAADELIATGLAAR